jgi:glucuronosyltransferase
MQNSYIIFSVLIITLCAAQCINCANILFLLPIATKSHKNVFDPLIDALANRGHEVTVISPVKTSKLANVKEIIPLPLDEVMGSMKDGFEIRREGRLSFFTSLNTTNMARVCNHMYENKDVQWIMKNEQFDLIIVNGVMNHCAFGIIGHFKCPHIVLTTLPAPASLAKYFGNYFPLSVVPEPFLPFSDRMSFSERTLNFLFSTTISALGPLVWFPLMESVYKKYLPNSPSLEQINNNASLLFMNSHFTLTYPRPLLPTVIEVDSF